ncbi:Putative SWR1-complex protein [[Torrubiella] hemipterigena]|uniref:SWR1-complex protein 5 n=1 Tax=[Torrubiella] hemipterigena TaxID=1531966 RepID=A0A0A1TI73_9HYPO|nr:Putative SWR1-complex protein [[Torrubiella] hemipterigena]
MSHDLLHEDEDEHYNSAEDSDFAPEDAADVGSEGSDSDRENSGPAKQKSAVATTEETDADYNNSGDEAIITKGRKKLKKTKNNHDDDDEEGGEGGLIKTRRQRAAEKEEESVLANLGPVTIDVDAVWAQMISGQPIIPERPKTPDSTAADADTKSPLATKSPANGSPAMIRIKRKYNFAGRVHTEEKLVARDSAEAKLYLASQEGQEEGDASPPKRVTKKAFRSMFEPLGDISSKRSDLNLSMAARMQAAKDAQAKKLTTVEKSRMDWAGFVDKEGIKDELELAGKSKTSYAARQDFLARSEAIREEDARKARFASRTQA